MSVRADFRSRFLALFAVLAFWGQGLQAADFTVVTREDILSLTARIQAAQFLTHATFGATKKQIDDLALEMQTKGTIKAATDWIDAQFALPVSSTQVQLHDKYFTEDKATWSLYNRTGGSSTTYSYALLNTTDPLTTPYLAISPRHRMNANIRTRAWWNNAIGSNDQLRHKAAWALSQIFSVAQTGNNFNDEEFDAEITGGAGKPAVRQARYQGLAGYYDIFTRNAFGNYLDMMGEVTYHPVMGYWLTSVGNRKASGLVTPDENYAREVMQLFSIGLEELNDEGVPTGAPTYNNDTIQTYAEIFTGLGYGVGSLNVGTGGNGTYSRYTGNPSADVNGALKFSVPMRMAPAQHDTSTKILLNGVTITGAGGTYSNTAASELAANLEIEKALKESLFNHPTSPAFVANRLIQRFVKSNPSRAYIQSVVTAYKGTGAYPSRGDMKATLKAILLHPEAWQPIRVQFQRATGKFVVSTMGTEDSRLQEPVCAFTRFIKFFNNLDDVNAAYRGVCQYQKSNASGVYAAAIGGDVISNDYRFPSTDGIFDQSPYEAPSVFNFYYADYKPSGEFQAAIPSSRIPGGELVAPEFNIVTALTATALPNNYRTWINGNAAYGSG